MPTDLLTLPQSYEPLRELSRHNVGVLRNVMHGTWNDWKAESDVMKRAALAKVIALLADSRLTNAKIMLEPSKEKTVNVPSVVEMMSVAPAAVVSESASEKSA